MSEESGKSQKLSGRRSDFLNDHSNVYKENVPHWHNRTAICSSPSKSVIHTSSRPVLNPSSTVRTSQLSDNWFENLSQSSSSKRITKQMRNIANQDTEEPEDTDPRSTSAEPVSKLMTQTQAGSQGKLPNDKSRAFIKPGPKFTKRISNDTSYSDKALADDSAGNRMGTRASRLAEEQQRLMKDVDDKIPSVSYGQHAVQTHGSQPDKTVRSSPPRKAKDPVVLPSKSAAESSKTFSTARKRPGGDQPAFPSTNSFKTKKPRHQKSSNENGSSKSDSLLGKRRFGGTKDAGAKQKKFARDENSSLNTSQSSKDKSVAQRNGTTNILKISNHELLLESSSEEELFTPADRREKKAKGQSRGSSISVSHSFQDDSGPIVPAGFRKDGHKLRVESDEESEYNLSNFWHESRRNDLSTSRELSRTSALGSQRSESFDNQVPDVDSSDAEEIYTPTFNRSSREESVEKEQVHRSRESASTDDRENDLTSSDSITKHRRRARFFHKKSTPKDNNPFDEALHRQSSAEKPIEETPRLSQRMSTAAIKGLQRLKIRLFEKSQAESDNDSSDNAIGGENVPDNRASLHQKSPNKSTNKRSSVVREASARKSLPLNTSKFSRRVEFDKSKHLGLSQPVGQLQALGDHRSHGTSSDGTQFLVSPRHASTPMHPSIVYTAGPSKPTKPSPVQLLSSAQLNDEVFEKEEALHGRNFLNVPPPKKDQRQTRIKPTNDDFEIETTIDWAKVKEHTDAVKSQVEAQERLTEKARKKLEVKEQRIEAGVRRLRSQKEAARKRQNKKPVHEAFMINGVLYKPPKLPRPKPWATNKLYQYLWKCMERKNGERTRVRSARFVLKLSEFVAWVVNCKRFERYSENLDELMVYMAKLGIIETRYDFFRFVAEFMPYNFRFKVTPMALPRNKSNIPFDKSLLFVPLLNEVEVTSDSESDDS